VTAFLDGYSLPAAVGALLINYSLYDAYVLALTHRYGGTLGKLAVGIRVAPVDGGMLTWGHVWRRSAVDLVASVVLVTGAVIGLSRIPFATYASVEFFDRPALLDGVVPWYPFVDGVYTVWLMSEFVVMMLNRRRRALHDFIAGTVVVIAPRRDSSPTPAPAIPSLPRR
jgi:uncharacterized RDD family membrane protein YckC